MKNEEEKLTVDTLLNHYPDKMIYQALEHIKGETPFYWLVNFVDLMSDYVTENERIDEGTKDYCAVIIQHMRFHLELLKNLFWYKEGEVKS